ncbi:MAG: rod shape-determining protein MreD [Elusimicrobiota bacterium]
MNRLIVYGGVFFAGLVIQFSFTQFFSIAGLSPNFLLIILIYIGLIYGPMPGQVFGFAWGLAWDIMSLDLFGSHAFLLTCAGFGSGLLSKKWNESKFSAQAVLVMVASVLFIFGKYLLYQIFSMGEHKFAVNYITALQPFYNMLITPVVFAGGRLLSVLLDKILDRERDLDFKRL